MSKADLVNEWFRQSLSGGPLARDTEAYNQVVGALPGLIAKLDASPPAPIPIAEAPKAPESATEPEPESAPQPEAAPQPPV